MCGECWESVRSVRGRWEVLGEYGEYRECLGSVRKGLGVSGEC